MVATVEAAIYFLRGKQFVIETDRANLTFLARYTTPKVVRICAYLRQYSFTIRRIPGSVTYVADWLSRFYHPVLMPELQDAPTTGEDSVVPPLPWEDVFTVEEPENVSEMLEHAHGLTHVGIRAAYVNLCRHNPGHGITQRRVMDFVMDCPTCQKK